MKARRFSRSVSGLPAPLVPRAHCRRLFWMGDRRIRRRRPFLGVLAGGAGVYSFYMPIWLYADLAFDPAPPETVVVTPDDADGNEPAGDEEKKAE
ncbi:hypothetical protein [Rhizobium leguminosarum]|uniref:hypothetical protein n=1 Tax=Rhizobium leguminosarum TaxID=384 RepID=UPI00391F07FD